MSKSWLREAISLAEEGYSWRKVAKKLGKPKSTVSDALRLHFKGYVKPSDALNNSSQGVSSNKATKEPYKPSHKLPKMLFLDIETSPLSLSGWGLYNQNYSLEQVGEDWAIISYAAKWWGGDNIFEGDISKRSEEELLNELWHLLNECDIMVAHNGRRFDLKKIKARMIALGFKPFSPLRVIDTLEVAKKEFSFTSNKLEYLTNLLCTETVKDAHSKFPGFSLWKEFMKGNPEAIKCMVEYNRIDIISLEELYNILAPWSSAMPVFDIYDDGMVDMSEWVESGYHYTNLGKYQRYRHKNTGQFRRGRVNLLSKEKRKQLLANII